MPPSKNGPARCTTFPIGFALHLYVSCVRSVDGACKRLQSKRQIIDARAEYIATNGADSELQREQVVQGRHPQAVIGGRSYVCITLQLRANCSSD